MNIIVGKNGNVDYGTIVDPKTPNQLPKPYIIDNRSGYGSINIFGKTSTSPIYTISGKAASKMLSGDRGKLGKIFDKKKQK